MHDTFLNARIFEALLKLCEENDICRINRVIVAVDADSHFNENSLRKQFTERGGTLAGEWTEIIVEKQETDTDTATAIIKSIEGEAYGR
jgi:Zn finger protein HypA/HybF involved in hydrogenase expression